MKHISGDKLRNVQYIKRESDVKKGKMPESAPTPFPPDLFEEVLAVAHRGTSPSLGPDLTMETVTIAHLGGPGGLPTPLYSTWVFQICHILTRVIISGTTV